MRRDQEVHLQTAKRKSAGPAEPSPTLRLGEGIARGAAVVASLTIVSRILGLVRTLVFSQTVGASCLGTAYVTANQVPDLLYQLILGGALASAMVPVLARSAERASTGIIALLSAPPRISWYSRSGTWFAVTYAVPRQLAPTVCENTSVRTRPSIRDTIVRPATTRAPRAMPTPSR